MTTTMPTGATPATLSAPHLTTAGVCYPQAELAVSTEGGTAHAVLGLVGPEGDVPQLALLEADLRAHVAARTATLARLAQLR